MINKDITEGFIGFKFLKEDTQFGFTDTCYSEFFNLTLDVTVQYKTLLFSNGEKRPLVFDKGYLRNISATITKRDLVEPEIIYSYSYEDSTEDSVEYNSVLAVGGDFRVYEGVRDICVSVLDPRYYLNKPELDIEVVGYINQEDILCYRLSSDDFQEEFQINKVPENSRLIKIGLNNQFKFQFLLSRKGDYYHYI